jgi:hypothetical protein
VPAGEEACELCGFLGGGRYVVFLIQCIVRVWSSCAEEVFVVGFHDVGCVYLCTSHA